MTLVRYLCLILPCLVLLAAARLDRTRAGRAGALLGFIGAMVGVAALHEVAAGTGWWHFAPVEGAFRGLPIDAWLGWGVLWGAVPVLVRDRVPQPIVLIGLFWLDAVAMPRLEPLVVLGPHWMIGELAGLACVALPAQLAGIWSARRERLVPRVLLQIAIFCGMALWLVPTMAFELGDGSWRQLLAVSPGMLVQAVAVLGLPSIAAVAEFAGRGGGTPYPWDYPARLVTTGPYAYVANPMQLSMFLVLVLLAAAAGSWSLALAAGWAVAFSAVVAARHEREQMFLRHGQGWVSYRDGVTDWIPRWRPYVAVPAVLFLDFEGCTACAAVRRAIERRRPVGLVLASAAAHPATLWAARYEAADGYIANGVAAVARGLEHLHLGWALVAWFLRLPGIGWCAQLVTDAFIAEPHPAGGSACQTPSSGLSTVPCGPSASMASPASRHAP